MVERECLWFELRTRCNELGPELRKMWHTCESRKNQWPLRLPSARVSLRRKLPRHTNLPMSHTLFLDSGCGCLRNNYRKPPTLELRHARQDSSL